MGVPSRLPSGRSLRNTGLCIVALTIVLPDLFALWQVPFLVGVFMTGFGIGLGSTERGCD